MRMVSLSLLLSCWFCCCWNPTATAQTKILVPTFETFQYKKNQKLARVKATIFIQRAIDYLYAKGGGSIKFTGSRYELGYFSRAAATAMDWRDMDAATMQSFENLLRAIVRNDTYVINKYLHNPDSDDHRNIFPPEELALAVAGEDLYQHDIYKTSITDVSDQYRSGILPNFPNQRFKLLRRELLLAPPAGFVAPKKALMPFIQFVPFNDGKGAQVRFVKLRMPKLKDVVPTEHQFLIDYINDNYRAIPKKAAGSQARYFIQGLDNFTRGRNDASSVAVRNLMFPTSFDAATKAAWETLERWNGCRRLFADFDLFTTKTTYNAAVNSPVVAFQQCVFDGNIYSAWEDSDKYQFEQAAMVFVAGHRQSTGQMVVNFEGCTWLDAVGDGLHVYNSASVAMNHCKGGNIFRGAVTFTGQNTKLHIDQYRDISYDAAYYDLTRVKNPRYIGKITVEVDGDASKDFVDYRLTNSFLYLTKIVDEAARRNRVVKQGGGLYHLENNQILYGFTQSTPRSRVRIKNCFLGASNKELLAQGNYAANLRFGYAADLVVENCTLKVVQHKMPFKNDAALLNERAYFVALSYQDTFRDWRGQSLQFRNCYFENNYQELAHGLQIGSRTLNDPLENKNVIILKNCSLVGNFETAFSMSGGFVTLDGLPMVKALRPNNKRSYFMRTTVSTLNLTLKDMDMSNDQFDFYYYANLAQSAITAPSLVTWTHTNIIITQQKNKINNMYCTITQNMRFRGSRAIIGRGTDPNLYSRGEDKLGFANDQYQASDGCIWSTAQTGCTADGPYTILWEREDAACENR